MCSTWAGDVFWSPGIRESLERKAAVITSSEDVGGYDRSMRKIISFAYSFTDSDTDY